MSDRILVLVQVVVMLLVIIPLPKFWPPIYAVLLFITGELILFFVMAVNRWGNWSIFPSPKKDALLIRVGIYRFVRHPMYLGLLLVLLSIILWQISTIKVLSFSALLVIIFVKIGREERYLSQQFENWAEYSKSTPYRLIPMVW